MVKHNTFRVKKVLPNGIRQLSKAHYSWPKQHSQGAELARDIRQARPELSFKEVSLRVRDILFDKGNGSGILENSPPRQRKKVRGAVTNKPKEEK